MEEQNKTKKSGEGCLKTKKGGGGEVRMLKFKMRERGKILKKDKKAPGFIAGGFL